MSLLFSEIYQSYYKKIYNLALNYVQHTEDAEEVTQDVFLKIYDEINQFKGDANMGTWVMRIAINKSLDFLRHKNRVKRKSLLISFFSNKSEWQGALEIPDFSHPGIAEEDQKDSKILFGALNVLPDNQRTAFILTFIEEIPQKEVTDIMELSSVKALESLLQRAKQNLRKMLEKEYNMQKTKNTFHF